MIQMLFIFASSNMTLVWQLRLGEWRWRKKVYRSSLISTVQLWILQINPSTPKRTCLWLWRPEQLLMWVHYPFLALAFPPAGESQLWKIDFSGRAFRRLALWAPLPRVSPKRIGPLPLLSQKYVSWAPAAVAQWIELGLWTKDRRFDPQAGHMPGLQAGSPVGATWEATTHRCFCPSISPSLPLSLKINKWNL